MPFHSAVTPSSLAMVAAVPSRPRYLGSASAASPVVVLLVVVVVDTHDAGAVNHQPSPSAAPPPRPPYPEHHRRQDLTQKEGAPLTMEARRTVAVEDGARMSREWLSIHDPDVPGATGAFLACAMLR